MELGLPLLQRVLPPAPQQKYTSRTVLSTWFHDGAFLFACVTRSCAGPGQSVPRKAGQPQGEDGKGHQQRDVKRIRAQKGDYAPEHGGHGHIGHSLDDEEIESHRRGNQPDFRHAQAPSTSSITVPIAFTIEVISGRLCCLYCLHTHITPTRSAIRRRAWSSFVNTALTIASAASRSSLLLAEIITYSGSSMEVTIVCG